MPSQLFTPFQLRGLTLPNRIVIAPMCQYSAVDGTATDWHMIHLGQLSLSGAGMLVIEATAVEARGRITPGDVGLYSDENEAALARIIAACRQYGSTPLGVQLAHAGRKASADVPWVGGKALAAEQGAWEVVAPSAVPFGPGWPIPHELTVDEIQGIKDAFVAAAKRSLRLGFDMIELHCAHGYLLHSFVSPVSNKRTDAYGGSLENRMRLPIEIASAVRAVLPDDYPLGIRVSAVDWLDHGWTIEDSVELSRRVHDVGVDFVCASSGGVDSSVRVPVSPGYQVPFAARIKKETGIPVRAVGMIADPHQAEEIVATGQADMVALARAVLDNPRWVWHAAEVLGATASYPPQYERAQAKLWPGAAIARPQKDAERKVA